MTVVPWVFQTSEQINDSIYYLGQPVHNIHINNEFLYRKYSYMFRCICIIFRESYFPFAKVTKSVRLQNQ
jgi:hypothetical protein